MPHASLGVSKASDLPVTKEAEVSRTAWTCFLPWSVYSGNKLSFCASRILENVLRHACASAANSELAETRLCRRGGSESTTFSWDLSLCAGVRTLQRSVQCKLVSNSYTPGSATITARGNRAGWLLVQGHFRLL